MAKKSFTETIQKKAVNPALQFLSSAEDQQEPEQERPAEQEERRAARTEEELWKNCPAILNRIRKEKQDLEEGRVRRMAVTVTPVPNEGPKQIEIIVPPTEKQEPRTIRTTSSTTERKAHQAKRANPIAEETKSRRVQILLTPSLYEAVREKAAEEGRSVNDLINAALWAYIRK